jgi:hypothetical protein
MKDARKIADLLRGRKYDDLQSRLHAHKRGVHLLWLKIFLWPSEIVFALKARNLKPSRVFFAFEMRKQILKKKLVLYQMAKIKLRKV